MIFTGMNPGVVVKVDKMVYLSVAVVPVYEFGMWWWEGKVENSSSLSRTSITFSEGLAAVTINGKEHLIDKTGNIVY
jgi:hypothetical protein